MSGIDHPSRDPNYAADVERGRRNMETMTFESDGARRDYERRILANPHNVMGLPEFFPPLVPRVSFGGYGIKREDELTDEEREERFRERAENEHVIIELHCDSGFCDRVTPHWVTRKEGFCQKCGQFRDIRIGTLVKLN